MVGLDSAQLQLSQFRPTFPHIRSWKALFCNYRFSMEGHFMNYLIVAGCLCEACGVVWSWPGIYDSQ